MKTVSITLDMEIAAEDEDVPKREQLQAWLDSATAWLQDHFICTGSTVQFKDITQTQRFGSALAPIAQGEGPLFQFLGAQKARTDTQVALLVVPEAQSQQLNADYRQKNRPTNVLSFPGLYQPQQQLSQLGDLVICARVVAQEAQAQQKSLPAHWAHLLLHGFLHLLGFDHETDDEAELMETIERRLMAHLHFPDPYANDDATLAVDMLADHDIHTLTPTNPKEPIIEA